MKIVILGDTHFGGGYALGKSDPQTHLNTRLLDFSNTFDYVIDYMINNSIYHFIITGDIFENRRPQASELSLFSKKIQKLSELGIHTYVVVGNHDLIKEQSVTTVDVLSSLKLPLFHVFTEVEGITIDNINIIFIPFRTREMLNCNTNEEAVERISTLMQFEINKLKENTNIVIGHLMIQGTAIGNAVLETSPGEVVLPQEIFTNIEAVIMGHVHPHLIVKKEPLILHLGSMECKDFSEARHKKYFVEIENKEELCLNFQELPVRKLYDIIVDQSIAPNGRIAAQETINYVNEFSKQNNLEGSIIRIEIIINEKSMYDLNKEIIRQNLKQVYKVNNCIGIFPQIISKRQLRKSNITERNDSVSSFKEYLEFEDDLKIRERMKQYGLRIISEKGKI